MKVFKILAYILAIFALCTIVFYVTLYFSDSAVCLAVKNNLSKNIGDFLWGTIGIILTFVSTLFLFLTFNSQQKQNKEMNEDAFRTRFEGTFFNMLAMYYNVRTEADKQISQSSKFGTKNLNDFYHEFNKFYKQQLSKNSDFSEAMSFLEKKDILKTEMQTAIYDLGSLYDLYIGKQGCGAGFYFRYIHNLITFVLNHWNGKCNDIHTYLNFIQAQMSDEELALVFYDSISNRGQDKKRKYTFKENLDEYSFLENISENSLIQRCHYKIFPKTMFIFLNDDERRTVVKYL